MVRQPMEHHAQVPRQTSTRLGSIGLHDAARPGTDAAVSSFWVIFTLQSFNTPKAGSEANRTPAA